ncbi:hypothetical protein O181_079540 [Austropuccinia psidii MF-1]|uniref:Uncharacterized protein n=1 Tax=Austropuccinia psidii MF-1 TaxID=1389203 RepID=A0A9Q3FLK6_9BASI|nr:hypothetical protein [Austropuccinia psidii MF-1]
MQQEYSTLYKDFLSPKSKGPGDFFRNINKMQISCNHHLMLNKMRDADLEDHESRSTQDNSSTITQTIVDAETSIMSSKIAHLLKMLLRNKQLKCGPTKLVVYSIHYHLNQSDHLFTVELVFHLPITLSFQHKLMEQLQPKHRRRPWRTSSIILNVKYSLHPSQQLELASTQLSLILSI